MLDIITVGSATWDCFVHAKPDSFRRVNHHMDVCYTIGGKILIDKMECHSGGGGTNVAVAFSRLGLKSGFCGVVGTDHAGHSVLKELRKEKVRFVGQKKQGMTGYSVILVDLKRDRTILTYRGLNNEITKAPPDAKAYYLNSNMGKSFATTKKVVLNAKKKKRFIAFNPSSFLAKKGVAYLKPLLHINFLLVNKEEAQMLLRKKTSVEEAAKLLGTYAKNVVVTDGANKVAGYDGTLCVLRPKKIKVVETTGAGDSFGAGTCAGLLMGWSLQEAMRLGQAEAESVLQHVGCKEKLLTKKEAKKAMKEMRLTCSLP